MRDRVILWTKVVLTAVGYVFLFAVSMWDPANLITLTGESQSDYDDGAKAASFALVAALAIAIQRIRTDEDQTGKYIDLVIWILGTSAAFLAAWYWLSDETGGNPRPYLEEVLIIGGIVVVAGLVSLGGGAAIGLLLRKWDNRKG